MKLLLTIMVSLALFTRANGTEPSIERLRGCAEDPDNLRRLTCYDREMGRATNAPESFGMSHELLRKKQAAKGLKEQPQPTMSAVVKAIAEDRYGRLTVSLDNGQVWAQQEDAVFQIKPGDTITIKQGLLGALWMVAPSNRTQIRVKRLK